MCQGCDKIAGYMANFEVNNNVRQQVVTFGDSHLVLDYNEIHRVHWIVDFTPEGYTEPWNLSAKERINNASVLVQGLIALGTWWSEYEQEKPETIIFPSTNILFANFLSKVISEIEDKEKPPIVRTVISDGDCFVVFNLELFYKALFESLNSEEKKDTLFWKLANTYIQTNIPH